jgi:hypothetical protein
VVASVGEMAGVCFEVTGGDGAREGSKEGVSRGVRVEDDKVCKNKSASYLRDRIGCTCV